MSAQPVLSNPHLWAPLFAGLPDVCLVLDRGLTVVAANDALLALLGRERAEVLGFPWQRLVPHLAEIGHLRELESLWDGVTVRARLPFLAAPDGILRMLDMVAYPLRDPDSGHITHAAQVGREVSEEVRTQMLVADANRDLRAAQEALETKAAEIQAANLALEEKCTILEAVNLHLERIAVLDVMTDLPNHRAFQDQLAYQVGQHQRHGRPFSLLLFDVDNFKQYNDRFGHQPGDLLLAQVARLMRECSRTVDRPARYGGEEFALLLPDTTKEGAAVVAERLRASVARFPFAHGPVTVSLGVAEFPADAASGSELINCADRAMYAAKRAGKNTVRAWGSLAPPLDLAA